VTTSHKCPHCGNVIEIAPSHSETPSRVTTYFAMVTAFLAGGWALLYFGNTFWGGASLVAAMILPPLYDFLTRYQESYPIRAYAKLERETARLLEIARREDQG
jgi:hypothetical protein